LTEEERKWLTENQSRIVYAVETNYAPFVFIGQKGQPAGLAYDFMLLVESKLGVNFKERRFSSLDEIFESVKKKEVHIVNAVTPTPQRSKFLSFTNFFISVPNVVIVNKKRQGAINEKELDGLKVSLVKSYAVTEYLLGKELGFTVDLCRDDLMALQNVSFGSSDAAVVDLATASYLIEKSGITNLRIAGEIGFDIRLAMATSIDDPILASILKKGVAAITDVQRQEISKRWINISGTSILVDWRFWAIVASVIFATFIVLIWNRTLSRQIALRIKAERQLKVLNDELVIRVEEELAKRLKAEETNQKEREALIQSEKMAQLGNMLGAIIHQWKQPLNAIAMETQGMRDSYEFEELDKAEIDRVVKSIMSQITFMSATADDFRDFYKPSKDKKVFSILEQIEVVVKLLGKQLDMSNISMAIDGDNLLNANGYTSEFKQVILNIINNSRDAFEEKNNENAFIHILLKKDGDRAILKIVDNAGGIPGELLPDKLFEPFTSTKGKKGTGIGLSLSKTIIEEHMQGKIKAENTEDGTCFLIELPIV